MLPLEKPCPLQPRAVEMSLICTYPLNHTPSRLPIWCTSLCKEQYTNVPTRP